jgi:hypothetical protein
MPVLKYKKPKTPTVDSKAAAEIKRILDRQDPPIGYKDASDLDGKKQKEDMEKASLLKMLGS